MNKTRMKKKQKYRIFLILLFLVFIISINFSLFFNLKPASSNNFENKNNYIKFEQNELVLYSNDLEAAEELPILESKSSLKSKNAYAIIIGISDYPGYYNDLSWADDDARAIYSLLKNTYNFKSENIKYLKDSEATSSGINNAFDQISSEINETDIFVFYYSGHGGPEFGNPKGLYLYDSSYYYESQLDSKLDTLNCAEKYIFLDTCFSGGFIDSIQDSERYIMTSSEEDEESWSTSEFNHGVFTHYLLKSHSYATDSNDDDVISMHEMFPYVSTNTISYMYNWYIDQHPLESNDISGETVLVPSLGSINFNNFNNSLEFNFNLYGTGLITELELLTVLNLYEQDYIVEDLTDNATSETGFGTYNGTLNFSDNKNASAWGISAKISGNKLITVYYTSPHDNDTDGLNDVFEIYNGLDPVRADSDFDGLNDYYEYYGFTNPLFPDSDLDGLLDGYEVFISHTDPISWDSDGDGLSDRIEIESDSDPLNNYSTLSKNQRILIISLGSISFLSIMAITLIIGTKKYKKMMKKRREIVIQKVKEVKTINYCPFCGKILTSPRKYCIYCGKKLFFEE